MKIYVVFFLFCVFNLAYAQNVFTKDGVSLGKRKDFITSCTQGADEKLMEINGLKIETRKYCACVADNLLPKIYSWELEKAIKDGKLVELFVKDKNLEVLMACLKGNYEIEDDYKFESSNPELQKEIGIKTCVQEIMKSPEKDDAWTEELAKEYCTCAMDKLLSEGYTYKEILKIDNENSSAFNEIALPCVTEILNKNPDSKTLSSIGSNDVEGGGEKSTIPLTDYFGNGYKIKIGFGELSKYFLLDTGASDLVIDKSTAKELLANGSLKRENYLEKTSYQLANKESVNVQLAKIDQVVIGDYTLNNVVVAILEEGSLLCGKSFLDKFKRWELDNDNKVLILYK